MHKSGLSRLAILAAALVALPGLAVAAEVVLYSSNPSELIELGGLPAHRRGDFGPASAYATILIISVLIPLFILSLVSRRDLASSL